jgi:hypothetical protein
MPPDHQLASSIHASGASGARNKLRKKDFFFHQSMEAGWQAMTALPRQPLASVSASAQLTRSDHQQKAPARPHVLTTAYWQDLGNSTTKHGTV